MANLYQDIQVLFNDQSCRYPPRSLALARSLIPTFTVARQLSLHVSGDQMVSSKKGKQNKKSGDTVPIS